MKCDESYCKLFGTFGVEINRLNLFSATKTICASTHVRFTLRSFSEGEEIL